MSRLSVARVSARLLLLVALAVPALAPADFWLPIGNPPGGVLPALAYRPASDAVFVGAFWNLSYNSIYTGGAVYRSLDHGATWTDVGADIRAVAPTRGRIRALGVSPAGDIFAGTDSGVFRSLDGGDHWVQSTTGLGLLAVRAFGFDSGGAVYAATDQNGVFVSFNGGANWTANSSGLTSLRMTTLAAGPGYMLAGTQDAGVFKRVGGAAWSAANSGIAALRIHKLLRASSGTLYAASDAGLYSSTTDAATWLPVAGPFGPTVGTIVEAGGALIATSNGAIFRSTDGGQTWPASGSGFDSTRPATFVGDAGGGVYGTSSDRGLFRSLDGGQTWAEASSGIHAHAIHRLLVTSSGTILAGTFTSGLFRSTDGGATWQLSPANLAGRFIFALAESPWGDLYAGNYTIAEGQSDGHAWRSQDDGQSWQALDSGIPGAAMVSGFAFATPQQVWCSAAWNPGGVFSSAAGGALWSRIGPPENIPAYCLLRRQNGDLYFGTEGRGVRRFEAATGSWQDLGLSASQQFALAANSQAHVFVGNDRHLAGVYRALDGVAFSALAGFPGNEGYALLVLPNDDIYAGTATNGIQLSQDNGDTWAPMNSGIPSQSCFSLVLGPDGHLYGSGSGAGVFRSRRKMICGSGVCVIADMNCDGAVDILDINPFVLALSDAAAYAAAFPDCSLANADVNDDGSVDVLDINPFVALLVER
ncbi:Ycf48-like protein [Phycisphaerae bacterium RAS1]|nr:Ycf48-like protein [Phycisphaerae bacterium RAS1]